LGGYNRTIASDQGSFIAGRQAWSGNSNGFITTVVNVPPIKTQGRLRWRMASDTSGCNEGRRVDSLHMTWCQGKGTPCPTPTATPPSKARPSPTPRSPPTPVPRPTSQRDGKTTRIDCTSLRHHRCNTTATSPLFHLANVVTITARAGGQSRTILQLRLRMLALYKASRPQTFSVGRGQTYT